MSHERDKKPEDFSFSANWPFQQQSLVDPTLDISNQLQSGIPDLQGHFPQQPPVQGGLDSTALPSFAESAAKQIAQESSGDDPGFMRKLLTSPGFIDLIGVAGIGLAGGKGTRGRGASDFLASRRASRELEFQQERQSAADKRDEERLELLRKQESRLKGTALTTQKVQELQMKGMELDLTDKAMQKRFASIAGEVASSIQGLSDLEAESFNIGNLDPELLVGLDVGAVKMIIADSRRLDNASRQAKLTAQWAGIEATLRAGGELSAEQKKLANMDVSSVVGGQFTIDYPKEFLTYFPGTPPSVVVRQDQVAATIQGINTQILDAKRMDLTARQLDIESKGEITRDDLVRVWSNAHSAMMATLASPARETLPLEEMSRLANEAGEDAVDNVLAATTLMGRPMTQSEIDVNAKSLAARVLGQPDGGTEKDILALMQPKMDNKRIRLDDAIDVIELAKAYFLASKKPKAPTTPVEEPWKPMSGLETWLETVRVLGGLVTDIGGTATREPGQWSPGSVEKMRKRIEENKSANPSGNPFK